MAQFISCAPAVGWVIVLLSAVFPWDDGVARPKMVEIGIRVDAFVAGGQCNPKA